MSHEPNKDQSDLGLHRGDASSDTKCHSTPPVVILQWDDFDRLCRKLAGQIQADSFVPQIIVGIQRGGCIPAVFLAHLLRVQEFCTLGIRTTTTDAIRATRQEARITGSTGLQQVYGKQVLIVDDVTNTGATLEIARVEVEKCEAATYKTAAVIWDGDSSLGCVANYIGDITPGWVTFPWEI